MWLKVGFYIVWGIVKGFLGSFLSRWRERREISNAVEPYKKELDIKNQPNLPDDAAINGLPE